MTNREVVAGNKKKRQKSPQIEKHISWGSFSARENGPTCFKISLGHKPITAWKNDECAFRSFHFEEEAFAFSRLKKNVLILSCSATIQDKLGIATVPV